jgi:AraC-like DNA-binding protein
MTSYVGLAIVGQRVVLVCQSEVTDKTLRGDMTRNARVQRLTRFPMASGGLVRLAYAYASNKGLEVGSLLRKAGLASQHIENSTFPLNVKSQIAFLNLVAAAAGDDLLGFHLAQDFDLREIGMLYYVMASSETLGDALQRATRYSRIVNEGIHLRCRENKHLTVNFEYVDVARHQDRHQIEFFMATLVRLVRQLSGRSLFPDRVNVTHHRDRFRAKLKKFFGCDVTFSSSTDEIAFPSAIRPMPLASADSYLHALLIAQCEQTHAHRLRPAALRASIENEIVPLLPHGNAQAPEIARRLGMSQRTLARRLAAEGLSFTAILDALKLDLAKHYLGEADLPITTIAWLLGYQEVSAFTHAYKRWTGKTPKQARTKGIR